MSFLDAPLVVRAGKPSVRDCGWCGRDRQKFSRRPSEVFRKRQRSGASTSGIPGWQAAFPRASEVRRVGQGSPGDISDSAGEVGGLFGTVKCLPGSQERVRRAYQRTSGASALLPGKFAAFREDHSRCASVGNRSGVGVRRPQP
jgi:hypothetical protein